MPVPCTLCLVVQRKHPIYDFLDQRPLLLSDDFLSLKQRVKGDSHNFEVTSDANTVLFASKSTHSRLQRDLAMIFEFQAGRGAVFFFCFWVGDQELMVFFLHLAFFAAWKL